jgi:hypothetical protein
MRYSSLMTSKLVRLRTLALQHRLGSALRPCRRNVDAPAAGIRLAMIQHHAPTFDQPNSLLLLGSALTNIANRADPDFKIRENDVSS